MRKRDTYTCRENKERQSRGRDRDKDVVGREEQHWTRGSLGETVTAGGKERGGGAEAWRPPDPTRPRQPGQRGRRRWGQRPQRSRG